MHSDRRAGAGGRRRPPDEQASLEIEPPADAAAVRRFSHEAMATVFEVHVAHPDARYASQAAQAAFGVVDRLERELSRFIPNSDIARINDLSSGASTRVSASTLECLVIARHVFDFTGGAFDISIGTGLPLLDLDADRSIVRATKDGVRLDLGAIGKGYAVDVMAELLEEWGITAALVHGGFSSVLALESPPGSPGWPLTFSDPGNPSRVLKRLTVRQVALGASGLRRGEHIIDPRTGEPARGCLAAWATVRRPEPRPVEGPSALVPRAAAVADAMTTALMILTAGEIERLCERSPDLEAWILPAGPIPEGERSVLHFGGGAD